MICFIILTQILMNAATEVMTATRMQHVLIPLDTLNAYVTQGLREMGVYVQVSNCVSFFFSTFCWSKAHHPLFRVRNWIFLSLTYTHTNKIHRIKKLSLYYFFSMRNTKKEDNENQPHFVHDINTKGCDVIGVTVFPSKFMRFLRKIRE